MTILTQFDSGYGAVGCTMIESLLSTTPSAKVIVLVLDEATASLISRFFAGEIGHRISFLRGQELQAVETSLAALKTSRSPWEFLATQKVVFIDEMLRRQAAEDLIWYVDSDTFFYSDLRAATYEMRGASIGISPHRFGPAQKSLEANGLYNAGFVAFRNNDQGRSCAAQWRRDCLAKCSLVAENGHFMNQGYLTAWPSTFTGCRVFRHPGLNLAPWNLDSHTLTRSLFGKPKVDGEALIFFHFSSVGKNSAGAWATHRISEKLDSRKVRKWLYRPYLRKIEAWGRRIFLAFGIDGNSRRREALDDPSAVILS